MRLTIILFLFFVSVGFALAQQMADPDFDATVAQATYIRTHPRIAIDQAHDNFHTKDELFKPFADLLRSDGYDVVANTAKFTSGSLEGIDVLVISDALGKLENDNNNSTPAFTKAESDAVYEWVRRGGPPFLAAGDAPMGGGATPCAE